MLTIMKKKSTKEKEIFSELQALIKKGKKRSNRHFNPDYKSLKIRERTIRKYIHRLCELMCFTLETFYLTVSLIDHVTSQYLFSPKKFFQISIVCLSLAAKVKENRKSFQNMQISKLLESIEERLQIERFLLQEFKFELNHITPFDYVQYFLQMEDTFEGIPLRLKGRFYSMIFEVLFEIVLNYKNNKFNPLVVAVVALMIVRKRLRLNRVLPFFVEKVTSYSEDIFSLFLNELKLKNHKIYKNLNASVLTGERSIHSQRKIHFDFQKNLKIY